VKRKAKPKRREATPESVKGGESATISLLPMELQIGDRFADQDLEWEVVTRPEVLHGAKVLRARIQRPGLPESEREMTWPAHVRVEIRRGQGQP
jgi:hypothetical protein